MPTAISADGIRHVFPDGTDPGVIDRVMKQYATEKQAAQPAGWPTDEVHPTGIGMIDRGISNVLSGKSLFGGESALGASERIEAEQRAQMKPGQKVPPLRLDDPMLSAFGVGNIGGRMPMRPASNPAAVQRLSDFQGQGITPNVPAVGQGRAAGAVANATRVLPFSPVQRGIEANIGQAQQATQRAAGNFGVPQDPYGAGAIAGNALKRFASDKNEAQQGFGKFWGLMKGAPDAPIPNTLQVLGEFKKSYPNAPELTDVFTSSPILRMANALEPRQVNIPAKTSSMLNQFGQPAITAPARTVQRGGKLSMDELRNMRSQIGEKLEQPVLGPDSIPRGQLKRLYGALTNDMYAAARAHNPAAEMALTQASHQYRLRMGIIDRLDRLTSKDNPDAIFSDINRAANEGAGADAKLLGTIKKVLTPQEWGDVGASIIQRLGNPKPGVPRAPGQPDFSVGSLATNWRKLTPRAKDTLFGPDTPNSPRAGLEQLSRVAASLQNVGKLANSSHTYENTAAFGIVSELAGMIASGRAPIPELAGLTGSYGVSKLLMSPAFTKWLYKVPSVVAGAPPMMASSLAMQALRSALLQESGHERRQNQPAPTAAAPVQAPPKAPPQPADKADYIEPPPRATVTGP